VLVSFLPSPETSVDFYHTIRPYMPKESTCHTDSRENPKSGVPGTLITLPTIGHKYFTCHNCRAVSLPHSEGGAKGAFPVARAHVCCARVDRRGGVPKL
jgi:hypothetical protein